jgi:hypothetical protein
MGRNGKPHNIAFVGRQPYGCTAWPVVVQNNVANAQTADTLLSV